MDTYVRLEVLLHAILTLNLDEAISIKLQPFHSKEYKLRYPMEMK
jgi:hypothetical protein